MTESSYQFSNLGIIFSLLPELYFYSIGEKSSLSAQLLKIARVVKNDDQITSDHAFFRHLRTQDFTAEDFSQYFQGVIPEEVLQSFNQISSSMIDKTPGSWMFLDSAINGYKLSSTFKHEFKYLDFILAHIAEEVEILDSIFKAYPEKREDVAKEYIKEFYKIELPTSDPDFIFHYLISLVCYWGALLEGYLHIAENEEKSENIEGNIKSILNEGLPTIEEKSGKLVRTTERFLERWKKAYSERKYNKDNIDWKQVYIDIEISKTELNKSKSLENLDPDIEAIKKRTQRWKKNGTGMTQTNFVSNYGILMGAQPGDYNIQLILIPMIQIFDLVQNELVEQGHPKEKIVKAFEKYPEYLSLVKLKYKNFKAL